MLSLRVRARSTYENRRKMRGPATFLRKRVIKEKSSLRSILPRGLCLAAALVLSTSAFAQYYFDVWTTDNSLPQNSVNAILQTQEGYI